MADKGDTHGGGDSGGGDQGGGDHSGGGAKQAKSGGGGGGGNWAMKLLRNPVTWAVAGVGALLAVVLSGVVPTPTVGTVETSPSTYSVPESQGAADVAESDGDVRSPSQPAARRSARLGARACHSIVQRARADHGRDWERGLTSKVRNDCGRTIQEARWVDGRAPLQVEARRGRMPGATDAEVVRLSVPYGDLDLTTSAGAELVLDRVKRAAIQVCGGRPDIRDLEASRAFRECVDRNMDSAVAQLRAPRVTALHRRPG